MLSLIFNINITFHLFIINSFYAAGINIFDQILIEFVFIFIDFRIENLNNFSILKSMLKHRLYNDIINKDYRMSILGVIIV
jgi:hypothetical protein